MELNEFVSGERLQEIADVTIYGTQSCNMPAQLRNTKTVMKDMHSCEFNLEGVNTAFLYGHDMDLFFRIGWPKIKTPFKLISHNTDEAVLEKYKPFLDDPKLIRKRYTVS